MATPGLSEIQLYYMICRSAVLYTSQLTSLHPYNRRRVQVGNGTSHSGAVIQVISTSDTCSTLTGTSECQGSANLGHICTCILDGESDDSIALSTACAARPGLQPPSDMVHLKAAILHRSCLPLTLSYLRSRCMVHPGLLIYMLDTLMHTHSV